MGSSAALIGGSIAAPIVGGIIGSKEAGKERRAADRARAGALAQFAGIDVPTISSQELDLVLPEFMGEYSPEMEQLVSLGPSAMEGIAVDPRLQQAQMNVLETMSQIGEGGLTPGDIAAMQSMQRQVESQEQARQNAILDEMQRRGVAGSGLELAARMSSSQAATDRAAEEARQLQQMAQARSLEALGQTAGLAGQVRGQQFGEESEKARAADVIAQWNAQNQQAMRQRNVQAGREAQMRNLSERQRLAEQQAAIRNYQQEANKGLQAQKFQQEMQLASGKAGIYGQQAEDRNKAAERAGQMWSGIGTGVGTGLAGMAKG